MILDNLSRALKTQNWLAVGIEFVIVIAGVVIGFQINAWNEGRTAAADETALRERLSLEAERALGQKRREQDSLAADLDGLAGYRFLTRHGEHPAYTDELCRRLDRSHVILWTPAEMPLLDEMSQTGALGAISDVQLRDAISQAIAARRSVMERVAFARSQTNLLRDTHPDLLRVEVAGYDAGRIETVERCDWAGMHADGSFTNAVLANFAGQGAVAMLVGREVESLERLIERLAPSAD